MYFRNLSFGFWFSALVAVSAVAEPRIHTSPVVSTDAPIVEPTIHARAGQNVRITWHRIGPNPDGKGDALYGFCQFIREKHDGAPKNTPILFWTDLQSGRTYEIFKNGKVLKPRGSSKKSRGPKMNDLSGSDDDLFGGMGGSSGMKEKTVTGWLWEEPLCGGFDAQKRFWIGTSDGAVVRLEAARMGFVSLFELKQPVIAIVHDDNGGAWMLTRNGDVHRYEDVGGLEKLGSISLRGQGVKNYAPHPDGGMLLELDTSPARTLAVQEDAGQLTSSPTKEKLPAPSSKYDVQIVQQPPTVYVNARSGQSRKVEVTFSKAHWDTIKCITLGPYGKSVFGTGWPVAWLWEYNPQTKVMRRHGSHYNFYQMMPVGNEIYMAGYYGIKLMRFDPAKPWTFDYDKHYNNKQPYPLHEAPWGLKDSNPRMVCKFRYLKRLNVRRPSGLAVGADGRIYVGAHNAGHLFYGNHPLGMHATRWSGALNWYDPKTETIGSVREPFVHREMNDLCSTKNGRYIAATTESAPSPYEPLPENFEGGLLLFYDTQSGKFVQEIAPTGGQMGFVEQADENTLVVYGDAGRYATDTHRAALVLFDLNQMAVRDIVLLRAQPMISSYGTTVRFERGPDNRIYFYGRDDKGTALMRIDPKSAKVDAIARHQHISDAKLYGRPGATFVFAKDRVYFASSHLVSVPLERIVRP